MSKLGRRGLRGIDPNRADLWRLETESMKRSGRSLLEVCARGHTVTWDGGSSMGLDVVEHRVMTLELGI